MKIWVLSDIHVELTQGWDLPRPGERPNFDVLVVAGDLIPKMERGVAWLCKRITDRPVIYIPGNHEFYGTDIDRTVAKARIAAEGTNIHVMQNDTVDIAGVRFIAATLWTDFDLFGNAPIAMNAALHAMNDYKRIRKKNHEYRLLPRDTLARHMESRVFIASELAKPFAGSRVVVSHHGPHRDALRPGYETDIISAAYTSALEGLMVSASPDLWIYGHVHISDDRMIDRTRVVSNSKGYGPYRPMGLGNWDNPMFDPLLVIEV